LTAAVDERASAVVSASGFSSFRTDTDASGTGGVRRWSHLHGWLPRLGSFVGREASILVDFPEILVTVAPRPVLVVAPEFDWHFPQADITRVVTEAKSSGANVEMYRPSCLAEFNNDIQAHVARFLSTH
jgi:hypothetical protein